MTETLFCACCYNVATHRGSDGVYRCNLHKLNGDIAPFDTSVVDALCAELAAMQAERDATEAALRSFCAMVSEGGLNPYALVVGRKADLHGSGGLVRFRDLIRRDLGTAWREPTGGES